MSNPHGTPIWYELMTSDPDASKRFYDDVVGWTVEPQPAGAMDYRMIDTGNGLVGGVMRLTPEMTEGGARPTWLFYIGVDDVDATAEAIKAAGGSVTMGPWDLAGVGRMALVADPQGVPFYVMRGASDESSTAYDRMGMGKCNWNELATSDQAAAQEFYATVFGWSYPDRMAMGDMGDYVFVEAAGATIGATMTRPEGGPPPSWNSISARPISRRRRRRCRRAAARCIMGRPRCQAASASSSPAIRTTRCSASSVQERERSNDRQQDRPLPLVQRQCRGSRALLRGDVP